MNKHKEKVKRSRLMHRTSGEMLGRVQVRFHLARGEHYMHWQITERWAYLGTIPNEVHYYNPNDVVLKLKNCRLKNRRSTALKIFNGENKEVCAWIQCDSVDVLDIRAFDVGDWDDEFGDVDILERVSYNPKVAPNWQNRAGDDIDKGTFKALVTYERGLYVVTR